MTNPARLLFGNLLHPNNHLKLFPYGVGCVAAYAAAEFGDTVSVEVLSTAEELGAAFRREPPTILALSNYAWNLELSYEVIRRAKVAAPQTIAVLGGPNYPNDAAGQRRFFERYPLVDFSIFKEGEVPFAALVRQLQAVGFDAAALKRQRPAVPGVHYRAGDDVVAPAPTVRERQLDAFPSPYLTGLLDRFFARRDLAPLLQTARGCPFQCTFCVEGEDYYTKVASVTVERFRAELEYIARHIPPDGSPWLQIADSNFGMYPQDLAICDVIAEVRERYGWPRTVEVSTGKNRKDRVLEAVARTKGAIRFGPALQSTDQRTLANIKRSNISETILMEMASAAATLEQRSYTELILGLPGDTVASHKRSIRAAMDAGLQRIKMYPLILLPGTEIAMPAARQQFGLQTRFRILPQCHGVYEFAGATFPSVEITELVIATDTMSFAEYLACKRFQLSVEIFYGDVYLEEIHGLLRGLGISMFDFVERCHAQFDRFPADLQELYESLERGVRDNLWETREALLAHFADPANVERYGRSEYMNSLGTLKAIALLDHIDSVLAVARRSIEECLLDAGVDWPAFAPYVDELIEYSRLRRHKLLDSALQPEATFRFAFDRILERGFHVDPREFRLERPRTMRFWHDDQQARDIQALCAETTTPALRARSFIYPRTDPGVSPYLRRSAFR